LCLVLTLAAVPALAQQLGSINGKITDSSGAVLPGVTVDATSNVLPSPRTAVSGADGVYQLPALPPGTYKLTFSLQGFSTATRESQVQLSEATLVDMKLAVQGSLRRSPSPPTSATPTRRRRPSAATSAGSRSRSCPSARSIGTW